MFYDLSAFLFVALPLVDRAWSAHGYVSRQNADRMNAEATEPQRGYDVPGCYTAGGLNGCALPQPQGYFFPLMPCHPAAQPQPNFYPQQPQLQPQSNADRCRGCPTRERLPSMIPTPYVVPQSKSKEEGPSSKSGNYPSSSSRSDPIPASEKTDRLVQKDPPSGLPSSFEAYAGGDGNSRRENVGNWKDRRVDPYIDALYIQRPYYPSQPQLPPQMSCPCQQQPPQLILPRLPPIVPYVAPPTPPPFTLPTLPSTYATPPPFTLPPPLPLLPPPQPLFPPPRLALPPANNPPMMMMPACCNRCGCHQLSALREKLVMSTMKQKVK